MNNDFKTNLRELRTEKGLSQKQLAEDLHFGLSTISKWENGKKEPSLSSLIVLAKYFHISIDYMVGLEE